MPRYWLYCVYGLMGVWQSLGTACGRKGLSVNIWAVADSDSKDLGLGYWSHLCRLTGGKVNAPSSLNTAGDYAFIRP